MEKESYTTLSDDGVEYFPPQKKRWLPLALSFILGVVTMAFLGVTSTAITTTGHQRIFPHSKEGSDPKTGLPLAWSNGDCGNSPSDAMARGCRYSIVLHSWLPQDCFTAEDIEDEELMHKERDWPYESNGKNLTMDDLHKGDYGNFKTTFDWHVAHCMYVWKRFHRVMLDPKQSLDSYTANIMHTKHCVKMIGGVEGKGMKDSGTKIFVKYPVCKR